MHLCAQLHVGLQSYCHCCSSLQLSPPRELGASISRDTSCPRLSLLAISANHISVEAVGELTVLARARKFCLLAHPQLVQL